MDGIIQFLGGPKETTYLKANGYGEARQMGGTSYYLVEKIGRPLLDVKVILNRTKEEEKPKFLLNFI